MASGWRQPPWFAKPAPRIRFLRELQELDDVQVTTVKDYPGGFGVSFSLTPHGVPPRQVTVGFAGSTPHVYVDGPAESPHRYGDGTLCMWYPGDSRELRWTPADGGGALVAHIAAHLVQEEWWRLTGEWVGAEVRHGERDPLNDPEPLDQNDEDI